MQRRQAAHVAIVLQCKSAMSVRVETDNNTTLSRRAFHKATHELASVTAKYECVDTKFFRHDVRLDDVVAFVISNQPLVRTGTCRKAAL